MANPISIFFLIITVVCQNKQHNTPLTVNEKEIISKRAEVANQGNHRTYRQQSYLRFTQTDLQAPKP
ncbi:MAG: hypothetical protein WCF03_09965 [Nitrososphaeraceae archaeon]|jgi:hypothetical protein